MIGETAMIGRGRTFGSFADGASGDAARLANAQAGVHHDVTAQASAEATEIERALVARARSGERQAFGELFERYQTPITNYLYRLVGDWETAADLAQDSFIKAYQALPRTDESLMLAPWLYRIATNTALDTLRRRKRISWVPFLAEFEPVAPGGDPAQTVPLGDLVQSALQAVPSDLRIPLVLHLHQGLSYKEIAELLGIAPNLVAVRVFRAREKFSKVYRAQSVEG